MSVRLSFLGGVGPVTGSKYLLEADGVRVLVDSGLFQGFKRLRLRNWAPPPVDPKHIDAVVLTHAHLDHSGDLPLLVKEGFSGPVICTEAARDLCATLLPDSDYLQEKDAEYANRHGFSKHRTALPLYTQQDAGACMERFAPVAFGQGRKISDTLSARFLPAGHILGAAVVELKCAGRTIVFADDLGRPNDATRVDPTPVRRADYLLDESTHGNRRHEQQDAEESLADVINRTAARGGTVLVTAFAVGGAQSLLFHLQRIKAAKRIPDLPVFLDSPMAINASEVFCRHLGEHRLSEERCRKAYGVARDAGAPRVVLEKLRHGDRDVAVSVPEIERWRGNTPLLVDDIVSTARTMIETVGYLVRAGMRPPARICGSHRGGATAPDMKQTVFSMRGLTKVYSSGEVKVHALRGVDIEVWSGEVIVLLGPSGSGKSTLLNIMGGLDHATSGRLLFKDMDLTSLNDRGLTAYRRQHVGFVFQFYNLIPSLTAYENVALVAEIADHPMPPDEALSLVGLEARMDHFPAQLSGGEQQRVAVARAIAKRPEVLLCDEPTGALDSKTGIRVIEALLAINAQLGTTTLIITHNASIQAVAHRVISFADGQVSGIRGNENRLAAAEVNW